MEEVLIRLEGIRTALSEAKKELEGLAGQKHEAAAEHKKLKVTLFKAIIALARTVELREVLEYIQLGEVIRRIELDPDGSDRLIFHKLSYSGSGKVIERVKFDVEDFVDDTQFNNACRLLMEQIRWPILRSELEVKNSTQTMRNIRSAARNILDLVTDV